MPTLPVAGGIDLATWPKSPSRLAPSERRTVVVKGYDQFVGLAPIALSAIEVLAPALEGYRIVFYSTSRRMRRFVRLSALRTGLDIRAIPKHALSHSEMMQLFEESRVYIGLSSGDGMPASMLEAMHAGCFPIQTASSCADEWVESGSSAILIDEPTINAVASALARALEDDLLVDSAEVENQRIIATRLNQASIQPLIRSYYYSLGLDGYTP